ncbi:MAG: VOC family protein [Thermomicrobiales bacterium]|nr:VOC family protein [Thermomicrobiales bacterium]
MTYTSTYLNFTGNAEEAFNFYKSVFGTEFQGGIMRHGDVPLPEGMPPLSDEVKRQVMNVALPLPGGHLLMASDIPPEMGMTITPGNAISLGMHPDSRAEADRLFAALSEGGTVQDALQEMFWGGYYGALTDRFGIQWLIETASKE